MRALTYILATITRHDRHLVRVGVDFEWSSNSWTHNSFRLFEMLFGRRAGIRVEAISYLIDRETIYEVYTFEATIAFLETKIREAFNFRFVPFRLYIPVLATPFGNIPASPYLFAIAYDAFASSTSSTNVTSMTWSHTCTGSNLVLVSAATWSSKAALTCTYNAVSMTSGLNISWAGVNNQGNMWYLPAPATGANNVVSADSGASVAAVGLSVSLSGAKQTGTLGSTGTNGTFGTTATSSSIALTSVTAGSMIVDFLMLNNSTTTDNPLTTGTNQTARGVANINIAGWGATSSTMSTTTSGTYTPAWSFTNDGFGQMAIEILAAPAVANGNFLDFM